MDWEVLDLAGLDWTGLDWTGLDWTGPNRTLSSRSGKMHFKFLTVGNCKPERHLRIKAC